jgi:hypothetical protein
MEQEMSHTAPVSERESAASPIHIQDSHKTVSTIQRALTSSTDTATVIVEKEREMGKGFLAKVTKQKVDSSINPHLMNSMLFFFLGGSVAIFAAFFYYFLCLSCSPVTTDIQPYWTDSVYAQAFDAPSAGLHVCQSFFTASILDCAEIDQASGSPTKQPTSAPVAGVPSPTAKPTSHTTPAFCLVPCTLPGFDCNTQYGTFNPGACNAVVAPKLGEFYGNFSDFNCEDASQFSCTAQQALNGEPFSKTPSSITVVYLSCTTLAQSFTNSV